MNRVIIHCAHHHRAVLIACPPAGCLSPAAAAVEVAKPKQCNLLSVGQSTRQSASQPFTCRTCERVRACVLSLSATSSRNILPILTRHAGAITACAYEYICMRGERVCERDCTHARIDIVNYWHIRVRTHVREVLRMQYQPITKLALPVNWDF